MPTVPNTQDWRDAHRVSPVLAADPDLLSHVVGRFERKYLRAVLTARTPEAEERAWNAFHAYLVSPATSRKPFAAPHTEADAVLDNLRALVQRLRQAIATE